MEALLNVMVSLFGSLEITIPMKQIALLIALSVILILLGKFKSALVANLVFIFAWTCIAGSSMSGKYTINNIVPFASSYAVIGSAIFFGIALMIFYAISE
ncbi:MAG: hypothetical protein AB1847_18890 [bacterium]